MSCACVGVYTGWCRVCVGVSCMLMPRGISFVFLAWVELLPEDGLNVVSLSL